MATGGNLEPLDVATCVQLLGGGGVGRIARMVEGYPVVVPVNYRVARSNGEVTLIVRARPGGLLDEVLPVGFEVDGLDLVRHEGWSVLVRGTLAPLRPETISDGAEQIDPGSWVSGRDAWLTIEPVEITGRLLRAPELEWVIDLRAYL